MNIQNDSAEMIAISLRARKWYPHTSNLHELCDIRFLALPSVVEVDNNSHLSFAYICNEKAQMLVQWKVKKYALAGIHVVELYTFRAYGQVARKVCAK